MSLTLNPNDAKKADNFNSVLKESGKYIGTITRAEKLTSKNKVDGLGLSIKTDSGATANYLDLYTVKENGDKLRGYDLVQALLCCARLRTAEDGLITFDKWDNNDRKMVKATAPGYPSLMGKKIGMVLQKELATNTNTGQDTERLNIVAFFEASTGLTASEILDNKTAPALIDQIAQRIVENPVYDRRKKSAPSRSNGAAPSGMEAFDDDSIPF